MEVQAAREAQENDTEATGRSLENGPRRGNRARVTRRTAGAADQTQAQTSPSRHRIAALSTLWWHFVSAALESACQDNDMPVRKPGTAARRRVASADEPLTDKQTKAS